jgi:Ca2+-binding EF-hand superfamily protein
MKETPMNLKKILASGALALFVVTAPAALAKPKHKKTADNVQFDQTFDRFDTNRDGVLTRGELGAYGEYFQHLDTNRDGRVTRAESRRVVNRETSRLRGMDTNRDGVVTRSEWRGNDNAFRQLDRNRDGVISNADSR